MVTRWLRAVQVQSSAALMQQLDVMVTSWRPFPVWDADFALPPAQQDGSQPAQDSHNGNKPRLYQCAVSGSALGFVAAVMAAHPSDGGMYVHCRIPAAAVQPLRASPVLAALLKSSPIFV
jgi:hypothetical protein